MVFHWSLSDSKSPQVFRTYLSILAIFSNAVVWIVSTRPPTSKSSRPFNNPLVTVPNAPITFGTIVTFMFNSFFNSQAKSMYLSFFSLILVSFSHERQLVIFHRSLCKSKLFPKIAKSLDCKIVVCEFEIQSRYYGQFRTNTIGKGMNPHMG